MSLGRKPMDPLQERVNLYDMTKHLPNVHDAYALTSRAEIKQLYADWAQAYDTAFCDAEGYQLPRVVAQAFVTSGGRGPVLDFGAGTGVVGEVLAALDVGPLDAVDLSDEMLAVAQDKGVYSKLHCLDVLSPDHGLTATYQGVVSAGTFTLGHVGPEGVPPLLDLVAPGGLLVLSINAAHFAAADFQTVFDALGLQIKELTLTETRIYDDRAHASHRDDLAIVAIFQKA